MPLLGAKASRTGMSVLSTPLVMTLTTMWECQKILCRLWWVYIRNICQIMESKNIHFRVDIKKNLCKVISSLSVKRMQIAQPHVQNRLCTVAYVAPFSIVCLSSVLCWMPRSAWLYDLEFVPGCPYFISWGFSSLTGRMWTHALPWTACLPSVSCMVKVSSCVSVSSCIYMIFIPANHNKRKQSGKVRTRRQTNVETHITES